MPNLAKELEVILRPYIEMDESVKYELKQESTLGNSKYLTVSCSGGEFESGEPIFFKIYGDAVPIIISPDEVPSSIVDEGSGIDPLDFTLDARDLSVQAPPLTDEAAVEALDRKLGGATSSNVGMDSSKAPGTDGGNLACAWAVNRIARNTLGTPIGGGLATANMIKVLRARHVPVRENDIRPGCIIISPTEGANVGHVGIIGPGNEVYSNSSSQAKWIKSHSVDRWKQYYVAKKKLRLHFFRLDELYFPNWRNMA